MKANEAPEKIYCGNNGHGNLSYSNQPFPNAVEYTRTDAFIEKAVNYMLSNIPDMHILGNSCKLDEQIVSDFRKAMESK